jgi:uncharacterized hydrophobic protein (TIGR00271 family)
MISFLSSNTIKIRKKTEEQLALYTKPSIDFFILMILSSIMATIGLLLNSSSIVIGAMMIAPLITPLFGFALSTLLIRPHTMLFSSISIALGTFVGWNTAIITTYSIIRIDPTFIVISDEILTRTHPNILYFLVAIISGIAGAYAYGRPHLSERIIGIAIAVALIPPLSVSGIGIAIQNFHIATQSILLFILNLSGILFGSIIVFVLLGFGKDIESQAVLK